MKESLVELFLSTMKLKIPKPRSTVLKIHICIIEKLDICSIILYSNEREKYITRCQGKIFFFFT